MIQTRSGHSQLKRYLKIVANVSQDELQQSKLNSFSTKLRRPCVGQLQTKYRSQLVGGPSQKELHTKTNIHDSLVRNRTQGLILLVARIEDGLTR